MQNVIGGRIVGAISSLTQFSCQLDCDLGIIVEVKDGLPLSVRTVASADLPRHEDAVCEVDWTWIIGSSISKFTHDDMRVRFELAPAGPLTLSVQTWQGKPFLAFQPFRAPK